MKPEQTEQFLIEELFNKSIASGKIEDLQLEEIDKLTGDASTRKYYRAFTKKNSYVVCLDKPSNTDNTFLVVQSFLDGKNIRVPKVYDHNLKRGYILEEDLGDMTLLQKLSQVENTQEEFNYYLEIINELLKLHKLENKDITETPMSKLSFDKTKLYEEIEFTVKYFIEKFLGVNDPLVQKALEEEFRPICERLDTPKKVLTHRDFHSRNIMLKNNDFIIIDFQDARLGIPQYDLVSLLEDCYYKVNGENKVKLIEHYFNNLPMDIHGQGNFETFMELYCDMQIQRVFKALGSFSYIYHTRKDQRYLKYIGFGMEKLRTTFLKHSKYDSLRKKLFKIYYES